MDLIYAKDGKLFAAVPLEICVPEEYFDQNSQLAFAVTQGDNLETFGLLFIRSVEHGEPGPLKLFNVPTIIRINVYESEPGQTVSFHGNRVDVRIYRYLPGAEIMSQYIVQGREQAEAFVHAVISGKLPKVLNYPRLIDIWWKNLEISGVSFKVPSKIYELILATVYRDPHDNKKRFGQTYGKSASGEGYGYYTGKLQDIVANLSTFSGFIFENMGQMINNGILNSLEGVDEPTSPLEKIIFY